MFEQLLHWPPEMIATQKGRCDMFPIVLLVPKDGKELFSCPVFQFLCCDEHPKFSPQTPNRVMWISVFWDFTTHSPFISLSVLCIVCLLQINNRLPQGLSKVFYAVL